MFGNDLPWLHALLSRQGIDSPEIHNSKVQDELEISDAHKVEVSRTDMVLEQSREAATSGCLLKTCCRNHLGYFSANCRATDYC